MISRRTLFTIILGVAAVLIVTWKISLLPASVVIFNQSGTTLTGVAVETSVERIELGTMLNGETRRLAIAPTDALRLRFRGNTVHVWNSQQPMVPGMTLALYVTPEQTVVPRSRIHTYTR